MTSDTPDWVSLREAAETTGKTIKTMRRWAVSGKVGATKTDAGEWRVRKADLLQSVPVAEAKVELEVLTAELVATREMFHTLAEDLAAARERVGRAETERDALLAREQAAETERDELRTRVEELEARRWWQRRS